jgi:hypothetical protein
MMECEWQSRWTKIIWQLLWYGRSENVIAGVYLLKLQAEDYIETKKISVVH